MRQSIKIAFRNFRNKPATYLINFVGLSISLSLAFILSVYCYSEFSADRHHAAGDRIYFVFNENLVETYGGVTPGVLKESVDLSIPQVQQTLRIRNSWLPATFKTTGRDPITTELVYTDKSFFQFFTYKCLAGNLETALDNPSSLVLVKSEAEKLFGTTQVVGETVLLNTEYPLTVTAVIEPFDKQTFLSIKAVSPVSTLKSVAYDYSEGDYTNWGQRNFLTFLKLENKNSADEVGKKITSLFPEENSENVTMTLMPLKDVYLNPSGLGKLLGFLSYIKKGNKSRLYVLLLVALLILFIAIINYLNISSSQRLETLKQIGMQKLIGASRSQLFLGMVTEAQLIFLGASLLAFGISIAVYPLIADFVGIDIGIQNLHSPFFIGTFVLSTIVIGFAVCVFPALTNSKARSIDLIKDLKTTVTRKLSMHHLNVTAQFTIAILLIAFTLFVFKQIRFGFSTIGYDEENRIAVEINDQLYLKSDVLKEQILNLPEVSSASITRFYPGKPGVNINGGELTNGSGNKKELEVNWMYADADLLKTLDLKLIEGNFLEDWNSGTGNKIVVNETFIREHGLSSNPIGTYVYYSSQEHQIKGVVKDFHLSTVNVPVVPLVLTNNRPGNKGFPFYLLTKIKTSDAENLRETVEKITAISKSISPDYPIEVSFLDAAVDNMYKSDVQFRRIFSLFAGSSIFISCLGIFALSLFDSRRRIKEIGVRKVSGARVSEVMALLNRDFVKWVVIAFVIATPIAWYAMNKWLENFAYKTNLSWWIFALAGVLALGIALLTVSWQSWRAATRNPVESLRYE